VLDEAVDTLGNYVETRFEMYSTLARDIERDKQESSSKRSSKGKKSSPNPAAMRRKREAFRNHLETMYHIFATGERPEKTVRSAAPTQSLASVVRNR